MAKQGSSDSSSEEHPGQDDAVLAPRAVAAPKRSYECSFCKRGFTNAQALGGHMNIHRRDRAKSSAKASAATAAVMNDPSAFSSSGNYYYYNNNNYVGPIFSTIQMPCPSVWDAHRDRDQQQRHVFFQQPGGGASGRGYGNIISNYNTIGRSSSHVEAHGYNLAVPPVPRSVSGSAEEVRWGANLSLRVGSGQQQQHQQEDEGEDDEEGLNKRPIWNTSSNDHDHLDLELRLGP